MSINHSDKSLLLLKAQTLQPDRECISTIDHSYSLTVTCLIDKCVLSLIDQTRFQERYSAVSLFMSPFEYIHIMLYL